MKMATDEEIQSFVSENKALIEKMMEVQKENLKKASEINKQLAEEAFKNTKDATEYAREKSEEFFKTAYEAVINPDVQRHFMNASMEFFAGLSALIDAAPIPDYVKEDMKDAEKNVRQAACKCNDDCPAKKKASKPKSE